MLTYPRAALASMAAAVLGLYMTRVEPRRLRVIRLRLAVPDLPPAFDGYRIVHVADLHLGVALNDARLPALVETVNAQHADLIAITGDFVTGQTAHLGDNCRPLAALHAPDGVWGCLGNHDYYVGPRLVREVVENARVRLLINAHHVLQRGPDRLVIAGVDDMLRGRPDLGAALAGAPDAPAILLAHEPDYARVAAADRRVTLMLAGHTHGGQVRLPGLGALLLPPLGHLYSAGMYQLGSLALYVTQGAGTGRFVIRLNCRPEIAVITLRRAPEPAR